MAESLPDDEAHTYALIRDTADLFHNNAAEHEWRKAVTRQMALYFRKAQHRSSHTVTVADIVGKLKQLHADKNYPPVLAYLKRPTVDEKKETIRVRCPNQCPNRMKLTTQTMKRGAENTTAVQFQDLWVRSLKKLFIKLYTIKNWPRKAITYYKACKYYVEQYPDATPWSMEDISFARRDKHSTEQSPAFMKREFQNVFQHFLNQDRTAEWEPHYTAWVEHRLRRPPPPPGPEGNVKSDEYKAAYKAYLKSPEFKAWLNSAAYKAWEKEIYFDDEFYTITISNLWEILSLPEGVLWREIARLRNWLPRSPPKKKKGQRV